MECSNVSLELIDTSCKTEAPIKFEAEAIFIGLLRRKDGKVSYNFKLVTTNQRIEYIVKDEIEKFKDLPIGEAVILKRI